MRHTTQSLLLVSAVVCAGASSGCERTAREAHTDSVKAQQHADKEIVEAKQEATDKVADAKRDVQQATDQAREAAAAAQTVANEKIRDTNREVAARVNELRGWAQERLDAVDQMIDVAKTKAQPAKATAKEKFSVAIKEVQEQRAALKTETLALETRTGDTLEKSKAQFNDSVDRIKARIRTIEKAL